MTVQELIEALTAIGDKTLPVWLEGCDCINPASGSVTVEEAFEDFTPRCVLIERDRA